MPVEVSCGVFGGNERVPTWDDHKKHEKTLKDHQNWLEDRLGKSDDLLDQLGKSVRKTDGTLSKLKSNTSENLGGLQVTLDALSDKTQAISKKLESVGFEKEIEAVFQRQFAYFDKACKEYVKLKVLLDLESKGVQRFCEEERQRHHEELEKQIAEGSEKLQTTFTEQSDSLKEELSLLGEMARQALEHSQTESKATRETFSAIAKNALNSILSETSLCREEIEQAYSKALDGIQLAMQKQAADGLQALERTLACKAETLQTEVSQSRATMTEAVERAQAECESIRKLFSDTRGEMDEANKQLLEDIQLFQQEQASSFTADLCQQFQEAKTQLSLVQTDIERIAGCIADSELQVLKCTENLGHLWCLWGSLNDSTWSGFWKRLVWLFKGRASDPE
jgi:uncharacterized phage infection (PIP) family protein YhgE